MRRTDVNEADRIAVSAAVGWIAVAITVAALWVITYYTLFPFDFVAGGSITDALRRFELETGAIWAPRAMPANIVLFLPLGFGLAGVARWRGWSRGPVVVWCTVAGFLLSAAIEVAQAIWLVRMPAIDDLAANTIGAALGALVWGWSEPRISRATTHPSEHRPRWRVAWMVVSLLPLGVGLVAAVAASGSTERFDWEDGNRLLLGNEATGERPWTGSIAEVALADRPLTPAEADQWLAGTPMQDLVGGATLLDQRFEGAVPAGWQTQPEVVPEAELIGADGALEVGPTQWLETPAPADEISRRISAAGSFTVAVDATSASLDQTGPGRIVAISTDPRHGNLLVGQDGRDLILRVRSELTGANGTAPEYAVHDLFDEVRPLRFVISYDGSSIRLTTDGDDDARTLELQPATATMLGSFVDDAHRLYFSRLGSALRELYFATFLFAPWCVCIGVIRARRGLDLGTIVAVLVPVVATELLLTAIAPDHDLQIARIGGIGVAALLLTWAVSAITRRASTSPG